MNIALILSGGTGTRLSADIPKQYIEVKDKPVIAYALEAFVACSMLDRIHVVTDDKWRDYIKRIVPSKLYGFSSPGKNRQLSILNGLRDIKKYASDNDSIIIHDAARPLVTVDIINAIIEKLNKGYEAVTPVLSIKDTIYNFENGSFVSTADRNKIVIGQTPEGFKLGKYLKATEALLPDKIYDVTGSLQVALDGGLKAAPVEGDERNFKITVKEDLDKFIDIINSRI